MFFRLMGPTGVGKSTIRASCFNNILLQEFKLRLQFISIIAGKEVTTIGHNLKSCTANFLPIVIGSLQSDLLKDGRLILVPGTPGFDLNCNVNDADILEGIRFWLETMYDSCDSHGHKGKTKLAGIVYFHDMSLTRIMLGSTLKNLDVFRKLRERPSKVCGSLHDKSGQIWDIQQEEEERQTEQLKQIHWKEIIDGGSTIRKFEDSQKSAWDASGKTPNPNFR